MKTIFTTLLFFTAFIFGLQSASALTVNCNYRPASCGNASGFAEAYPSGGLEPYRYQWSNGQQTKKISFLAPGTYWVMVYDSLGSFGADTVTIDSVNGLSCTIWFPGEGAGFECTGDIRAYDLNGIPPYTATWCDGYTHTFNDFELRDSLCATSAPAGCTLTTTGVSNYLTSIVDATGCSTSIAFLMDLRAKGFAPPNPIVTGECNHSYNGSIRDTLDLVDSTFLVGGQPFIWRGLFWGNITLRDSATQTLLKTINLYSDTLYYYEFTGLTAGVYTIDYFLSHQFTSNPFRSINVTVPNNGSACGNLSGDIYADLNQNCIYEPGIDIPERFATVEITPGNIYTTTDYNGHYSVDLTYGSYSINHTPSMLAPLNTECPAFGFATVNINAGSLNVIADFADTSNGADIGIDISMSQVRPGRTSLISVTCFNASVNPVINDTVSVSWDVVFTSPTYSDTPITSTANSATFATGYIGPLSCRYFYINVDLPPNASLVGTTVLASATLLHNGIDIDLTNNSDSVTREVTSALDPNHISSTPAGYDSSHFIPKTTKWIDYYIEFMNTGNDTAFNVSIKCPLTSLLDWEKVIPINSSHSYSSELMRDGTLKFNFDNINLPDSSIDFDRSKGFVCFRVGVKYNTTSLSFVEMARIYFDYNPPVSTNTNSLRMYDCLQIIPPLQPLISGCDGMPLQLTTNPNVPCTLNWMLDSVIQTGNPAIYPPPTIGTHTLNVTAVTPYCSLARNSSVESGQSPPLLLSVSNDTLYCSTTAAAIQWFLNGDTIPGATHAYYVYHVPGNYTVIAMDTGDCAAFGGPLILTRIQSIQPEEKMVVYPNPGTNNLTINFPGKATNQIESIKIFNMLGVLVYESKSCCTVNTSELPVGIYEIIVEGERLWNARWVKE